MNGELWGRAKGRVSCGSWEEGTTEPWPARSSSLVNPGIWSFIHSFIVSLLCAQTWPPPTALHLVSFPKPRARQSQPTATWELDGFKGEMPYLSQGARGYTAIVMCPQQKGSSEDLWVHL